MIMRWRSCGRSWSRIRSFMRWKSSSTMLTVVVTWMTWLWSTSSIVIWHHSIAITCWSKWFALLGVFHVFHDSSLISRWCRWRSEAQKGKTLLHERWRGRWRSMWWRWLLGRRLDGVIFVFALEEVSEGGIKVILLALGIGIVLLAFGGLHFFLWLPSNEKEQSGCMRWTCKLETDLRVANYESSPG